MGFFTKAQAEALAKATVRCATLVDFAFDKPVRVWNGMRELTAGGRQWSPLYGLGQIDGVTAARSAESQEVVFTLSGVNSEIVSLVMGDADRVQGRIVTAAFQLFRDDWQTEGDPFVFWFGLCQSMRATRSEMGPESGAQRTVSITAENLFFNRSRPPAGRYTDRDQKKRFPGDRILEFTPQLRNFLYAWPS